jgi:molybdopterin synthase sulfur carrier subunit
MKIKLFGGLRQKSGRAELEVSGATIREALAIICTGNEKLREAIFNGHVLHPHVRVMVNGLDCELAQGLDTPISADDQIAIFPPIAGG